MSARTFNVLAPNGRRQTVKCSLNTTILHILEEVCQKQGLNSIEYDIKHHNKALDTSMTIQFSGLPNNAQLELGPANKKRKESEVTVALNLENGSRLFGTFQPSNTLKEILTCLYDSKEPNPVVIYMRREIYGEELSKTDLRSLGLTGGRAMFRVVHKAPEELKSQANVSTTIPVKPVMEKPYKRVFKPINTESHDTKSPSREDEDKSINASKVSPTSNNISVQADILKLAKGMKQSERNEDSSEVSAQQKGKNIIKQEVKSEKPVDTQSDDSYSSISNGEQLQQDYLNNITLDDFPFIGLRKGLIFPLESGLTFPQEDPPDEFFNLTVDDAKVILRDIKKTREDAEEGGPLLTSQLRQLEESKKQLRQLNTYSKCIIRVLFPDRTVLQGVFSPTESVNSVIEFVAEYLADNKSAFYLFTTPPKFILPADKRLIEVDCVPGALLHFGRAEKYQTSDFFREDLKDKFTTNSIASLAALKIREEAKRKREEYMNEEANAIPGCSKDPDFSNTQNQNLNTTAKIPKWFKGT